MECIVLAGGLGTRLQGVIGDYPKCMAPINDKPFLHYVFKYLTHQKCTRVVLSLGYKYKTVLEWLGTQDLPFEVDYTIEYSPLGTGGGISLAMWRTKADEIFVLNGDTMFNVDLPMMAAFHKDKKAETTLALKGMQNFDRYGTVVTDDSTSCITSFEEKKYRERGWINGGVYLVNKAALTDKNLPIKYSFEKDYFEAFVQYGKFYGFKSADYFIDIGIPADYEKAQEDFKTLFRWM